MATNIRIARAAVVLSAVLLYVPHRVSKCARGRPGELLSLRVSRCVCQSPRCKDHHASCKLSVTSFFSTVQKSTYYSLQLSLYGSRPLLYVQHRVSKCARGRLELSLWVSRCICQSPSCKGLACTRGVSIMQAFCCGTSSPP